MLSHTNTISWNQKPVQKFVDAKRDAYDWRAAIIWDANKSLNEELAKHGMETRNATIAVTYEMASVLHSILSLVCKSQQPIPDVQGLKAWLESEIPKYIGMLEKYPDGQTEADRDVVG